jgi:plasmid maintenance system antidote protein VapI
MAKKKRRPIPTVLREAINNSAHSVNHIAAEAGVPQSALSRFVRSERSLHLETAERLAEYFDLRLVGPDD